MHVIQGGPVKFDTSPHALIALKEAGVSDLVLNAMLTSGNNNSQSNSIQQPAQAQKPTGNCSLASSNDAARVSFFKCECNDGTMDGCANLGFYYSKGWGVSKDLQQATSLFKKACDGGSESGCRFQRAATSSTIGSSSQSETATGSGNTAEQSDAARGVSFQRDCDSGTMDACASLAVDYRMGWGVSKDLSKATSLIKKACDGGSESGCRVQESWAPPSKQTGVPGANTIQSLTLRVLQEQSVPYTQESGGGISTSCNIVGTANTSAYVSAYGNSAYGNATTNSNQHMSCNSYDTTMRWPHVLNVMFAQASDGNSYIIACDRAWRWSKCVPLRAGDVFKAHFTDKGIEVEAINTKGKEENPTYHILQSRSSR